MLDLSFWQIFLNLTAAMVILTIHGCAVAALAAIQGDPEPRHQGKLTLNPFAHVDPFGVAALTVARVGWTRPVGLDPRRLRTGAAGIVICWLGAIAVSLAVAHLLLLARPLLMTVWPAASSIYVFDWLGRFGELTAWFALFNLLPIVPFTGGLLLALIAPALYRRAIENFSWIGAAVMVIAVVSRGWIGSGPLRPLAQVLAP